MIKKTADADLRIFADLDITLTDTRFAALERNEALHNIALGEAANIQSITVEVGNSPYEGIVTIDNDAASVRVQLGELDMMRLRLDQMAFLGSHTFRVHPEDATWENFDRVIVARDRGRQAPPLPSSEEMAALLLREAAAREAAQG
jgi:hypothetical protein